MQVCLGTVGSLRRSLSFLSPTVLHLLLLFQVLFYHERHIVNFIVKIYLALLYLLVEQLLVVQKLVSLNGLVLLKFEPEV